MENVDDQDPLTQLADAHIEKLRQQDSDLSAVLLVVKEGYERPVLVSHLHAEDTLKLLEYWAAELKDMIEAMQSASKA